MPKPSSSEQFATLQEQIAALQNDLRAQTERLAQVRPIEVAVVDSILKETRFQLASAESKLGDALARNLELQKQLDALSQTRPQMGVEKLVEQFRTSLDGINKAVMETKDAEKRGVVVEQMEVEIKGGLDLQQGIQLTQLLPQEVTPASVSTIRFSLRPVSTIKIVEDV
jgi:hypothetical protein